MTKQIQNPNIKKTIKSNTKTLTGVVVSDKMKDTVVVLVNRFVKHPKYGKYISIHKKFKAHDKGNTKKIGDKITIKECKPISKDKHFRVVES
ncbi:MAG: 30S ribosomal protein S17 [Candidatus Zambryskibacteria bacterium RIFCSPLOWO2_02_FULL_39_26]|uniref:Small ribosomal subunit protein uS17 n=1 Tax=Candidatus Zambryskibacteria bacterium RIFCSPLOWO2_12_FULL_39_23 TaxID=1802776 RepID=A0A1G2USS0_9BACT|nr:MAG: 30S ribosomal protein S17 [Candidatus Zambryskibacteria bacterium RIFCSPHIGHO2_02_39_10]OHA99615.1 MAG: 30S ribosomal protein S17 [Candidatus Zambryskibacteria bacterium RIFCSPHIGHO2_12_FULL_39_47]OHB10118.1 MAG: 30S ribosomal protein S17 [Candidatus Zambryskibacteria bacterium RIFCSPLOWO2_02_FULL_39_26]OHB12433.1 MAG: 30S ribosomal protein S17 [Candidatus Zambryskibacteria bacterium RIFCSPLOWO2_12_FULL_39_23]